MKTLICFSLLLLSVAVRSQDRFAELDKEKYMQGDTLGLTCNVTDYKKDNIHFATVYLLVEHMNTGKKWTYRYPLVDGKLEADLIIDTSLPTGNYALTFLTRKRFFDIRGTVEGKKEQKIDYSILTRNEDTHTGTLTTDSKGSFSIENVLFQDTSYFIFSTEGKKDLKMNLVTMLDSASFQIDRRETKFIVLGNSATLSAAEKSHYQPAITGFFAKTSLPNVTVTAKKKRKVDLFNETYSKGLFRSGELMLFDGMDDHRIGESMNVFEFLRSRVPGLIVTKRQTPDARQMTSGKLVLGADATQMGGGGYSLTWRGVGGRGGEVDVFLDEFKLTEISENTINPKDVAMIKVFQPPAYLTPVSSGGGIAIYTKKGGFDAENSSNNSRFRVFGYTPAEYTWK